MAIVRNLILRAGADFSGLNKSMRQAQRATKQFRNSFKQTARNVARVAVVMGAAMTYASKKAIDAAESEMISQEKLSVIMRQRMGATDDAVQSILDLASAQQKLGVIGDDVTVSGAQQLATFLNQTDSLEALVPAMNNLLAQQKGVNATQEDAINIGNMMGKVFTGQVGALKRVGISFTDAQEQVLKYGDETEKAAMLAEVITDNVGEMNKALANTPMGRVAQLKNSFGDLQEEFGKLLMPLRDAFVPVLQRIIDSLGTVIQRLKPLIGYATVFINTLFGNKAATNVNKAAGAVSDQANAMEDLGDAAKETSKQLMGFDEINQMQADTGGAGDMPLITPISVDAADKTNEIADGFEDAAIAAEKFKKQLKAIADFFTSNTNLIIGALGSVMTAFGLLKIAMNWGAISGAAKAVWAVITTIAASISWWAVGIIIAIALIVGAIIYLWQTNEEFRDIVKNVWEEFNVAISEVFKTLQKLKPEWDYLMATFGELMIALTPMLILFTKLWGVVTLFNIKALTNQFKLLVAIVKPLLTLFIALWSVNVLPKINMINNAIFMLSVGLKLIKSLAESLISLFGTLARKVSGAFKNLPSFGDIVNGIGGIFGNIFSGLKLPGLANGGITGINTPTPVVVGDNQTQQEVIAPLDDLINILRNELGGNQTIKLQIGSTEFEQVVSKTMRDYSRRTGGAFA